MTLSWYAVIFAVGQNCKALSFATCDTNQTKAHFLWQKQQPFMRMTSWRELSACECCPNVATSHCLSWPCWNSVIIWPQNCCWEVFCLSLLSAEQTWQVRFGLSAEGQAKQFPSRAAYLQTWSRTIVQRTFLTELSYPWILFQKSKDSHIYSV